MSFKDLYTGTEENINDDENFIKLKIKIFLILACKISLSW